MTNLNRNCPKCKKGKNSEANGGNNACFHCDTCPYVECHEDLPAPSPHTEGVDEKIHKPVIETMNTIGYGLLKDGKTFYQKGMELSPRDGITFTMTQAYEIHKALHQTREEGRREERKYIFSLANKIRLLPENLKEQIESYEKFLKEQRQRLKGGGK